MMSAFAPLAVYLALNTITIPILYLAALPSAAGLFLCNQLLCNPLRVVYRKVVIPGPCLLAVCAVQL